MQNRSVLIVEDDHDIRQLMQMLLTRHGFRCSAARSVMAARDAIAGDRFDCILLDVGMPGRTNGFDLLEAMKEGDRNLLGRTIIVSGWSEAQLAGVEKYEIYGVVSKPFDIDDLVSRIRSCCDGGDGSV